MFRSLLVQILKSNTTVRSELREAYLERCRVFGTDRWEWPQGLLEKLFQQTILRLATQQQVTIFVDALDEAGSDTFQRLADYFHQLNQDATKNAANVKICISCRHYPIVDKFPAKEIIVEAHNDKDIATYIKHHLDDMVDTDGPHQEEWKDLMKALIKQARGVFQWAHIVMPLIKEEIDDGRSPRDIRHWLPTPTGNLEDMYQYILERVIKSRYRTQAFQFFQWAALAERPLTVTEMRYAMAANKIDATRPSVQWQEINDFVETDESMRRMTKTLSGGLAEVVKGHDSGETIQFVHRTVKEFMRTTGLAYLSSLIKTVTPLVEKETIILQCQATLYRSCLFYLLATVKIPCESLQDTPYQRKVELLEKVPFSNYATKNLLVHAKRAIEFRSFRLEKEISILQKVVGGWVEFYQAFGSHEAGCPPAGTTVLHMAATANMTNVAAELGCKFESLTAVDKNGDTPLHSAARWGHVEVGNILLEKGAMMNTTSRDGETALIKAASRGHVEFVELLLLNGADINVTANGVCALSLSTQYRHEDIMQLLLGCGANVETALQALNLADDQMYLKQSALDYAAAAGNHHMVKAMISAGAEVNHASKSDLKVPLHLAAESGQIDVVTTLLDANADPTKEDSLSRTVLYYAGLSGSTLIAQTLETALGPYIKGFELGLCYRANNGELSVHKVQITKRMSDYILLSDILHAYKQKRCQGLRRYSLKGLQAVKPIKVRQGIHLIIQEANG